MERLCFGTFVDVLISCKKEKINKTKLVGSIIHSIDPDHKYMTKEQISDKKQGILRALNHLYKCTGDFTPTYSDIVQLAPKAKKESVVGEFEKDVIPLINRERYTLAILTLCDIIKKDSTLNYEMNGENVEKFQHYIR